MKDVISLRYYKSLIKPKGLKMKQLGQRTIKFPGKTNHTHGFWKRLGWKTWWESHWGYGRGKQKAKVQKDIEEQIEVDYWMKDDDMSSAMSSENYPN